MKNQPHKQNRPGTHHNANLSKRITAILQALESIPARHQEDAWHEACVATLRARDPIEAILNYGGAELNHEHNEPDEECEDDKESETTDRRMKRILKDLEQLTDQLHERVPNDLKEIEKKKETRKKRLIRARDIARLLGISPRAARKKMHAWAARYDITILIEDPANPRSPIAITSKDFQSILQHEPELSYARRHRRNPKLHGTNVIRARNFDGIYCPQCGSRDVRTNGRYPNRRYFKCLPCAQKRPGSANFIVQLKSNHR